MSIRRILVSLGLVFVLFGTVVVGSMLYANHQDRKATEAYEYLRSHRS